jgi:hypothetical protein
MVLFAHSALPRRTSEKEGAPLAVMRVFVRCKDQLVCHADALSEDDANPTFFGNFTNGGMFWKFSVFLSAARQSQPGGRRNNGDLARVVK